ncbi:MAG TPA: DUF6335 family protein [Anaerolineales bacterium]|nr:DUF6335 family protein [Anaerolineales bacterium]
MAKTQKRTPGPADQDDQTPEEAYLQAHTEGNQTGDVDHVDESPTNTVLVDDEVGQPVKPYRAADDDEAIEVGTYAEGVMNEIDDFTDDRQVIDDFAERQEIGAGDDQMLEELREYTGLSPDISGGDLDADWQSANQSGEEAVGGSVVTPDQDRVDEIGEALGIEYEADEPLHTEEKLAQRDRDRWELNPESAEENP